MLSWVKANSGWTTNVCKNRWATGPLQATSGGVVIVVVVAADDGSDGRALVEDRGSGRGTLPWQPQVPSSRTHSSD